MEKYLLVYVQDTSEWKRRLQILINARDKNWVMGIFSTYKLLYNLKISTM